MNGLYFCFTLTQPQAVGAIQKKETYPDKVLYILSIPHASTNDTGFYECSVTEQSSGKTHSSQVSIIVHGNNLLLAWLSCTSVFSMQSYWRKWMKQMCTGALTDQANIKVLATTKFHSLSLYPSHCFERCSRTLQKLHMYRLCPYDNIIIPRGSSSRLCKNICLKSPTNIHNSMPKLYTTLSISVPIVVYQFNILFTDEVWCFGQNRIAYLSLLYHCRSANILNSLAV